jgi:predicted MFS family arabinose efflux permease
VLVAAIQIAIMGGAAIGGAVFHQGGATGAFVASALILVLAGLTVGMGVRPSRGSVAVSG